MNKRIQELAIQAAGKGFQTFVTSDLDSQEKINLFAELIVREHLSLLTDCYRGTADAREWDNALLFLEKHIKEHFGVE